MSEPEEPNERPPPEAKTNVASETARKDSTVLSILFILSIANLIACCVVSTYLGGHALGILPSQQGFVLKSHGHYAAVSESAWVFSLFYTAGTLLIFPLVGLAVAVEDGRRRLNKKPLLSKIALGLLSAGLFLGVGGSFLDSYKDWQKLKHQSPPIERVTK